jgi:hypothetical protein
MEHKIEQVAELTNKLLEQNRFTYSHTIWGRIVMDLVERNDPTAEVALEMLINTLEAAE